MNNIDKIKAKIEWLYDGEVPKHDQQCDFSDGYFTRLATISNFIDSLSEEKPSEDLEKEVRIYCSSSFKFNYDELNDSFYSHAFEFDDVVELARHFYELGKDEMREQQPACKDLEEAAENCVWKSIDSNNPTLVPKFIPLLLSLFISGAYWQKEQMLKDSKEDVLLLERAWLTLDHLGHEELAERLKTFKEKYANKM